MNTPPEELPELSHKLNKPEREALKEGRPLFNADDDLLRWIDCAVEHGSLKFKPNERGVRAESLNALALHLPREEHTLRQARLRLRELANKIEHAPLIVATDLRSITRESDRLTTTVTIALESNHPLSPQIDWLTFGQGRLRLEGSQPELAAYLPQGVTDVEHDSAFALRLPLAAVHFEGVEYHTTRLTAFVAPRALDDFRVPWPGYNPMKHPKSETCEECKTSHCIVPACCYVPYCDPRLYKEVEGRRITMRFSPIRPKEESHEGDGWLTEHLSIEELDEIDRRARVLEEDGGR